MKIKPIIITEGKGECMDPEKLSPRIYILFMALVLVISGAYAANPDMLMTTPFITIDLPGNHTAGEEFFISGTTNLAASDGALLLQVGTAEYNPWGFGSPFYTSNMSVQQGKNGVNTWSADILPSRWEIYTEPPNYYPTPSNAPPEPGKYQIAVSSRNPYGPEVVATQYFFLASPGTGTQDRINILVTITNNAQENSYLNGTTGQEIKPLNPVPVSNMKKIKVPEQIGSAEKQKEMFSDRDWAIIRKSMTDLTEQEQDQLINDWKKILNNTSSLNPEEQQWVSMKMGYYIINATEGGKPVKMPDRPGLTTDKPVQTSAAIPVILPFIAIGGFGIIRLLLLRNDKK
jgi:hypothetical protein